jgi:DNA-binding MarR family transcriptional regulator
MGAPADPNSDRILLGLLESVERDGANTQRRLAAELGVALGLVNVYLKRCVKKGLVKMKDAPARRYVYYLTPRGFTEKSRLTVEYLASSFSFFRQAREACADAFAAAQANGWRRVALAGMSDLAEVAALCAIERGIEIVAVVDQAAAGGKFMGRPIVGSFNAIAGDIDGIVVTDVKAPLQVFEAACRHFDAQRVLAPRLPGVRRAKAIA